MKHDIENCIAWLEATGWKIEDFSYITSAYKLEDWPHAPDVAASKFGETCLFWYAHKGAFPFSQKKQENVTGFDYPKAQFMKAYQDKTSLKAMLIFKPEIGPFIAKQLDQLGTSLKWFTSNCVNETQHLQCKMCWVANKTVFNKCKRTKRKPLSLWQVKDFAENAIAIQKSLL